MLDALSELVWCRLELVVGLSYPDNEFTRPTFQYELVTVSRFLLMLAHDAELGLLGSREIMSRMQLLSEPSMLKRAELMLLDEA